MGPCIVSIYIYIQQDATLQILFNSGNRSTCFGWYLHPSSGAHTAVSTAFDTCQTVIATCRYRGGVGTGVPATDSSYGLISARCCRDSCMCSWCGCRYHPKHVQQFPEIDKLCNAASCWIYIRIWKWVLTKYTQSLESNTWLSYLTIQMQVYYIAYMEHATI